VGEILWSGGLETDYPAGKELVDFTKLRNVKMKDLLRIKHFIFGHPLNFGIPAFPVTCQGLLLILSNP